jgi:phosphoenolpyruvate carboxylase
MYSIPKSERFENNVVSKFTIYNSVFITLPFDTIYNTGALLPIFHQECQDGLKVGKNPSEIFESFASKYLDNVSEENKIDLLFRFIQYVERQIVLFDAVEDAAFDSVNNLEGSGSIREIKSKTQSTDLMPEIVQFLETFKVRTVLTAHPTQFYPGAVLGIINDLTKAINTNDLIQIKELLAQLGKTKFIKKEKPTPLDEAISLIWYLENVFYQTIGELYQYMQKSFFDYKEFPNSIIDLGFWPGGDRDGNPYVTTAITLEVSDRLRKSILKCYYIDFRNLRRKLTFPGIDTIVIDMETKLYRSVYYSDGEIFVSQEELKAALHEIKRICISQHQSLYIDYINDIINKVTLFGFHFATLDIRQNSKIHEKVVASISEKLSKADNRFLNYKDLSDAEKINLIANSDVVLRDFKFQEELSVKTLESIQTMKTIQSRNGELGCNRYIISNNESALNVIETLAMFGWCDWKNPTVDIVPLFESVNDLKNANNVMEELYTNTFYSNHLKNRGNKQTIMLGFSDGTKDGGYLMANWGIFKAKETITEVSRKYGIKVVFFDGRGGPPSRGGGKTNKFYASLGDKIDNHEIQLTIQGQTISSNFGTKDSCRFNLENLLNAGIYNEFFNKKQNILSDSDHLIMDELSEIGYQKYLSFKNDPKFIPYLEKRSTLRFYAKTNIGSRPSKRSNDNGLNFEDLRAIPFVGSWSQMKQNVPGFFGVGTALEHFEKEGKWESVQQLFKSSLFFKTLLENSMMSIAKSHFDLTRYMQNDPEFGAFWNSIHDEYLLSKRMLLKISGHTDLMENYPDGKASIAMREDIVLPLLIIQQYALLQIYNLEKEKKVNEKLISIYEKLVIRSLFGNTNASRNSA